ncbi:MAG TPA: alkaline phosphatase family protein [Thermohalobaculum sp.]|nr:alkaline phosphatase family protein [Thermohalobaculum sp.]
MTNSGTAVQGTGRGGKVLFVVIDQLRADCVSGGLAGAVDLPNLRALMAESVSFANHFTVTTPCGPARASLLTGLYAMNHRSVRNGAPLERHHTNLALEARKAGYEPLLFGYTDTSADPAGRHPNDPDLKNYEGLMAGFAEVVQMRLDTNYAWRADLKAKGYVLPEEYLGMYGAVDHEGNGRLNNPTLYRAEDSDTAFLTNETLKALSVREDQDWFAHVTYLRPHPPLAAPAPYNDMYAGDAVPLANCPSDVAAQKAVHPVFEAYFSEPAVKNLYFGFDGHLVRMTESDRQSLRAIYLGLATEVDAHIGRLIDYLKASGQYDDTLIIVTADHGEMLGDHFMWGKESIYDPAFHVPLIIRDPHRRQGAGTVVDSFTEAVDIAPTLLDWMGLEIPPAFNGYSLLPFVEGAGQPGWRDHVFCELDLGDPVSPTRYQRSLALAWGDANLAILRERRFKYVHFNGGLPPLLFDMVADPSELNDLAGDPAYAPELLRLSRRMLDHRMSHAARSAPSMKLTAEGVRRAECR